MNALSNRVAWLVGSALSLVLSVGCDTNGSDIDNSLGTETNWLVACVSSAECGALACECGVCTRTCTTDSACKGGGSCSKSTSGQVSDLCQNYAPPAAGLCLPECTASCADGAVCLGDRCVAPGLGLDASVGTPDAAATEPGMTAKPVSSGASTSSANAGGSATVLASQNSPDAALSSGPADAAAPVSSNDAGNPPADYCLTRIELPVPDGCCYADTDCAEAACYQMVCTTDPPVVGRCATPPDGSCFGDRDCASGETCSGGQLAQCGTLGPDQVGTCISSTCDFDSCHPERCDAIGEPCCDPLPNDGPNYCNGDLACESGSCAAAPFGPVCGDNQCAAGEVCCDRCDGSCAPAASGASCAEDSRPAAYQCDAIGDPFYCGPSAVCTSPLQQYCTVQERNGISTSISYSCTDGPGRCVRTQTCDCLLQELPDDPGATCVKDAGGMMTVTLSPVTLPI